MTDGINHDSRSEVVEVHDQTIGAHRVSFVTQHGVLRWVIVDDAHFTDDEFYEMTQRFQEFREEFQDGSAQP